MISLPYVIHISCAGYVTLSLTYVLPRIEVMFPSQNKTSPQPRERSGRAMTGLRNTGEVVLDRDLTAGNAGKLDGDCPGLLDVGLGAGVCEELALGEGHGRVEIAACAAER